MFRRLKHLCSFVKKQGRARPAIVAAAPVLLLGAASAWAQGATQETAGPVRLLFTVPVPVASTNATNGMYGFDISFVDQTNHHYYLGDRSNAAVDDVDANTGVFVKQITASPPFAGVKLNAAGTAVNNNISGPNGVATDGSGTCLFAGDGPSRVVSFALPSGAQVSDLNTGGVNRADEMAFDPQDRILAVANNADDPPFVTLINVGTNCTLTRGSQIVFIYVTNGIEQPIWDPGTQRFYVSVPSVSGTTAAPGPTGAIYRLNPKTGLADAEFLVPVCGPAGLSLGPNETFLIGCNTVYDEIGNVWTPTDYYTASPVQIIMATNGAYTFVPGVGSSDEVWYNSGDNHWYTGSSNTPYSPHPIKGTTGALSTTDQGAGLLGVIDGSSQYLDQIVPTFNVPGVSPLLGPAPGHPSGTSHSVAANAANNWVFVPMPANNAIIGCPFGCIGVFGRWDPDVSND